MDWASYPAFSDRVLSMIGIEIHWLILQYVLGLPLLAVVSEIIWLKTKDERWLKVSRTLAKGFVMVFAVGAAMGTASEFGLVLLWPNLVEAAGKYIYFPLYAEIFAFMMEVIFVYMFYYAWKKLPAKAHIVVGLLALTGAWFSATMIVSVNSYMQAPTGIMIGSYAQGYPKLMLVVPNDIVSALNVTALQNAGMDVLGKSSDGVIVALPSAIVKQIVADAFSGKTIKDSILYGVLTDSAKKSLANVPVKAVLDAIVWNTVKHVGVYTVTFQSPVFRASVLHTIMAGITVSSFTALAFFGYSAYRRGRETAKLGYKFALAFAVVSIILQGLVTGHEMGVAVAEWNREKFAAILHGSPDFIKSIELFLAYGNPNANYVRYDEIPNWLKPPTIIHELYYTKIGLAVTLALIGLVLAYFCFVRKKPIYSPYLLVLPVIAQVVSFLGWAVREIGRKPWTIYGIMDVQTAHTINPPSPVVAGLLALYFIGLLVALGYGVYRFLWRCGE
ncbi:cytochrome ubiquinol oxidase subunit I [Archaeoglobus sp.]